jgi:hypothetical protein
MFKKFTFLILFLSAGVHAQLLDDVLIHQIEQFFLGGQYDTAYDLIDKSSSDLENSNKDKLTTEKLVLERKSYKALVEQFNALERVGSNQLDNLIEQYQKLSGHFEEKKVSLRAFENYTKFLSAIEKEEKQTALKHYLLAKHYSDIYTQSLKLDVLNKFERAKHATQNDQLQQARELIDSLKELTMFNSIFEGSQKVIPGIRDEIILLERKLDEKVAAANIHNKLYEQSKNKHYTWAIFGGGSVINNGPKKDVVWEFQQIDAPFDVFTNTVDQINSTFGGVPSIEVIRNLTRKFQLGMEFEYGKIIHSNLQVDRYIYNKKTTVEYKSARIMGHFLFHNKIGLKPYLSFGIGYNDFLRTEMPATSTMISGGEHFKILKDSEQLGQIIATFGSEYIPSINSNFALRFYLSGFYNMKEQDLISTYNYCLGVQVGFIK